MQIAFGQGGTMPTALVQRAYDISFGDMPEGIYAGGVKNYKSNDKRETILKNVAERIKKDLITTGNEYASGLNYSAIAGNLPVLIPIYVEKEIIDLVRRECPLYELLPKRAIQGKFYDFNQMTARNVAAFLAEGAALAVSDDTYGRTVVAMKYAYATGKVSGPSMASMRGYIDILREQVQTHTQSLVQLLENEIINGSVAVNPLGFNGLVISIVTNVVPLAGAALQIADMRNAIRQAKAGGIVAALPVGGGNPNLIVTDLVTVDDVKALLQAWLRYPAPTVSLAWGIQTVEFEGLPIISSKFMTTLAANKIMLVLDTSKVFLAVLQDIVLEELARTDDGNKFMLKWYGALVVTAEMHCAQITGIA